MFAMSSRTKKGLYSLTPRHKIVLHEIAAFLSWRRCFCLCGRLGEWAGVTRWEDAGKPSPTFPSNAHSI